MASKKSANITGMKEENAAEFDKEQILKSKWFTHRRDILNSLLKDNTQYTHAEVDKLLSEYLEGKVI